MCVRERVVLDKEQWTICVCTCVCFCDSVFDDIIRNLCIAAQS